MSAKMNKKELKSLIFLLDVLEVLEKHHPKTFETIMEEMGLLDEYFDAYCDLLDYVDDHPKAFDVLD